MTETAWEYPKILENIGKCNKNSGKYHKNVKGSLQVEASFIFQFYASAIHFTFAMNFHSNKCLMIKFILSNISV